MKTKLILSIAVLAAIGFTSCEKCTTCKYTYKNYNGGIWDNSNEVQEYCGSASHIKEAEENFMLEAENSEKKMVKEPICFES